jgi:hypothetical protein
MARETISQAAADAAAAKAAHSPTTGRKQEPEWAKGLKSLYDQVVDEPLPDSFQDLLARLDQDESSDGEDIAGAAKAVPKVGR